MTVNAVSNPYISGEDPDILHDRAPGYGIVKLNRKTQLITLECWPRYSDPESFNAEQYPGWPVMLNMQDNYARETSAWLPPVRVNGLDYPPVVQVIDEITGEIIYTLRTTDYTYQPGVFRKGTYTLIIGEPGTDQQQAISGLISLPNQDQQEITLEF